MRAYGPLRRQFRPLLPGKFETGKAGIDGIEIGGCKLLAELDLETIFKFCDARVETAQDVRSANGGERIGVARRSF
jgi:hypothetical protein